MGSSLSTYHDHLDEQRRERERKKREAVNAGSWLEWDSYFFNIAYAVSLKSKDQHTKIGCVIVGPDNEIVSTGYNSLPRGANDFVPERYERPEKYNWMSHAERNAIFNAARVGIPTKGCAMYMSCGMPCIDCMHAIVQSGIKEIYLITDMGAKGNGKYKDFTNSEQLARECGILVCEFTSDILTIQEKKDG